MKREAGSSQGSWPPPTVVEARAGLFPQNPGSVALPVPCSLLPQDWESLRFCVTSPGLFVTAVLGTEPPSTVWSPWRSSHLPSLPAQPKRARPSCPQPPSRSQWLPHFPRRLSHRSFHFLAVPGLLCSRYPVPQPFRDCLQGFPDPSQRRSRKLGARPHIAVAPSPPSPAHRGFEVRLTTGGGALPEAAPRAATSPPRPAAATSPPLPLAIHPGRAPRGPSCPG